MNRKLLFAIIFVLIFAIGVIIWFFFYAQKATSPSLGQTNNPLLPVGVPKRFNFIFKNNEEPESITTTEVTFPAPQILTEIWKQPATGQTFVNKEIVKEILATTTQGTTTISTKKLVRATSTILMFVDRITGHVYAYNREINEVYQVSNTTLPGIYDAYIIEEGKRIVLRYADNEKKTIVGIIATIPDVGEKAEAKPLEKINYLPSQVTSVAVNDTKTSLSYLVDNGRGSSIYTLSPKGAILIASSPLKEWSLFYGGNTLYATSKPSAYVEGQTVKIPSFEFIIGNKTGLISNASPSGIFINSMWSNKGLKTFITNKKEQTVLSIATIASKCAWGDKDFLLCAVPKIQSRTTEGFPDDWYQGRISFDDSLMFIDPLTSNVSHFYTFDTPKKTIFDVSSMSISSKAKLAVFNRKQNASLWLLDINLLEKER